MTTANKIPRIWFSPAARRLLPQSLDGTAKKLVQCSKRTGRGGVVVWLASEILQKPGSLPRWAKRPDTRFLTVLDVSPAFATELPTILGLHKPDQRLYLSQDKAAVRRFLVAQFRDVPGDGIIDAYVFENTLFLLLGDLTRRSFAIARIEQLAELSEDKLLRFEINEDGSYISWPDQGLDFGLRQLLKQVDPEFLARLEIERSNEDFSGESVRSMREEQGLNQRDIKGLSERQVRRIEKGESSLTLESARRLSESLGLSLDEFLEELAVRSGRVREWIEGSARAS